MLMADEPAHVGRSLAEADLYETQFECGFYATGKVRSKIIFIFFILLIIILCDLHLRCLQCYCLQA